MEILKLTSDTMFKAFMLSENTKHFKAKFIHEITKIPEEDIINAIYTSEELKTTRKDEHTYRTDILVKIEGHIINIEMNETYYEGLFLKNHAYLEKINSEKYEKGESYINGIRVMQINIDDFNHYKGNKLLYTFKMLEEETREEEGSNIISYHIDLSYMKGKCYNECKSELEKLCLVFTNSKIEEKGDKYMEEAREEIERLSKDKEIIGLYDAELVEKKVWNTKMAYATKIGLEKGMKEGLEQGLEQGKREVALKMLEKNMEKSLIREITGLTDEEIEKLN